MSTAFKGKQRWYHWNLDELAHSWYQQKRKQNRTASERSEWWIFSALWKRHYQEWLNHFRTGQHSFSPMKQFACTDEIIRLWSYRECFILHLILMIIKSAFKHIISPRCVHLMGPSVIKQATQQIKAALDTQRFQ